MSSRGRWIPAVAIAMLSIATPAWAGPSPACSVLDPIWRAGHNEAEEALAEAVDAAADEVAEARATTARELLAAVEVATRQASINGAREAGFEVATAEAAAQVHAQQRAAERIRQAHATYGPQGQAVGGCDAADSVLRVSAAITAAPDRATEVLGAGAIDAVPGSTVPPLDAARRRLAFDAPEAVSAVAFLDPDTSQEMRDAFMNNVIGLPVTKPTDLDGPAERLALIEARRLEAIRSPAIVSLAAVRAAHEEAGHFDAGGSDLSTAEAIGWILDTYGGGSAYEDWSAALVTKSEVGLLKEIARLRAMQLGLANARAATGDRRQAVIAALLAAEAVR